MWYMKPVTASVDVPQPRETVYAFLDVMANHERFTDHMLVDWRLSGPPTGVGSKANVTTKMGGLSDEAEIEVIEIEPGRMIRERSTGAKGKRIAHGTYELSDLPEGGTHVEFTFALQQAPLADRALAPVMRAMLGRGNAKAMQRLAEQLPAAARSAGPRDKTF
jgi:hypothetical protein